MTNWNPIFHNQLKPFSEKYSQQDQPTKHCPKIQTMTNECYIETLRSKSYDKNEWHIDNFWIEIIWQKWKSHRETLRPRKVLPLGWPGNNLSWKGSKVLGVLQFLVPEYFLWQLLINYKWPIRSLLLGGGGEGFATRLLIAANKKID